jgi:prefoldin subunit 5
MKAQKIQTLTNVENLKAQLNALIDDVSALEKVVTDLRKTVAAVDRAERDRRRVGHS